MFKKPTKNKTKSLISLAVYQLMLRKIDYNLITVKDICATAGVSRMSFYRYYNNKDEIFIDFCDERFAEFYEDFVSKDSPNGHDFVQGMFRYFRKYSRQLLILKRADKTNLLMAQFDSYARYLINNWKTIKNSIYHNSFVPTFISGGFFNVLMNWVDGGMKESEELLTEQLFSLFPYLTDQ